MNEPAPKIAVLIPTYQNAGTLGAVIEGALEHVADVLIVDDGSTDNTSEVLEEYSGRIRVCQHEKNRGKGVALRTGFQALRGSGFSHAITVDADGQHFPGDLPEFTEAVRREPSAIVVGQRDMQEAGAPRRSLFGLWFSNLSLRALTGARLKDSQAGFRAYPLERVEQLDLRGVRYDLELEVLIKAANAGVPLVPVPIQCSYTPKGGRVSHFRPVRDFLQVAMRVLRLVLRLER